MWRKEFRQTCIHTLISSLLEGCLRIRQEVCPNLGFLTYQRNEIGTYGDECQDKLREHKESDCHPEELLWDLGVPSAPSLTAGLGVFSMIL